jgi:hypothetical protein
MAANGTMNKSLLLFPFRSSVFKFAACNTKWELTPKLTTRKVITKTTTQPDRVYVLKQWSNKNYITDLSLLSNLFIVCWTFLSRVKKYNI